MLDDEPICESWPTEPLTARMVRCFQVLYYHGLISDGEAKRMKRKLRYRERKQAARLGAVREDRDG